MFFTPLSRLYGIVVQYRNTRFDNDLAESIRVPALVMSVGNISAGGTGKTPFVQAVAKLLADQSVNFGIISRGYGRQIKNKKREVIVCDGSSALASVAESGDEPMMHAEWLLRSITSIISGAITGVRASVIVNADRVAAARTAIEQFGAQVVIMDDGFQHRRLQRDIDIVLIDAETLAQPFLLPRGRLREPLQSLLRADVVVCMNGVRTSDIPAEYLRRNALCLEAVTCTAGISVAFEEQRLEDVARRLRDGDANKSIMNQHLSNTPQARLYAVCGIAKPIRFYEALQKECGTTGVIIGTKSFPDHHRYTQRDVERICQTAQRLGCTAIVTTEKDIVKLRQYEWVFSSALEQSGVHVFVLSVKCVITSGEEALRALIAEKIVQN